MANLTTESISESTKKILCDKKLYKDINFFEVPHNKVFKKSWFSIYASVKDTQKNGLKSFTNKVIELVKEDLK